MVSPIEVAKYFIKKGNESGNFATQLGLNKLVYISYGWYLGLMDKPLFVEKPKAWKYGPIIPSVYYEFLDYGYSDDKEIIITEPMNEELELENDEEMVEFLDKIWNAYKNRNALQLSSLAHKKDSPWEKFTNGGKKNKKLEIGNGTPIPDALIREYYKELVEGNKEETQKN